MSPKAKPPGPKRISYGALRGYATHVRRMKYPREFDRARAIVAGDLRRGLHPSMPYERRGWGDQDSSASPWLRAYCCEKVKSKKEKLGGGGYVRDRVGREYVFGAFCWKFYMVRQLRFRGLWPRDDGFKSTVQRSGGSGHEIEGYTQTQRNVKRK